MKKRLFLLLLFFTCYCKNDCFASDTLLVFFNPADSNQFVTKRIRRVLLPPFFKHDMCSLEKSCWLNLPLQDSGKTMRHQFCFTYIMIADSVTQDESDAVDDAWELMSRYKNLYRQCKTKKHHFDTVLALTIKACKAYNKYGHMFIKKDRLVYHDPRVIDLSTISTAEQLTALAQRMDAATVFVIDLAQQRRKNKWLAYKVTAEHLRPVEEKL